MVLNLRNIILIAVIAALVVFLILMWRWSKKQEKKRDEQQEVIDQTAQSISMLVIDKKKMRMRNADLPKEVLDSVPWYSKRAKVGIVKVKVGPKVLNMVADNDIFDLIPLKTEIKATVSGIYITNVRGIRTNLEAPPKKSGLMARLTGRR